MNKTVTINISGIIFHIEEDAYEKLSRYLGTIKGYFSKTDGGNEIMGDIEARIAEMLQSKTNAVKQVVLMADVDSVMETMGKPEEFAGDNEQQTNEESKEEQTYSAGEQTKKRMFRDPDNKSIGGVCSGIAAYFDVDTVWIRLAMFLLIFFGGVSLWVYIILWIVIPEAKTTADKLAMRGEKIDINNISKTVKEEAEQLKKRMQKHGNDFKNMDYSQPRNFFDKLGDFLKDFLIIFTKFFARVIGLILLIFGVCFMFGLLSSIGGFSIMGANTEFNDWVNLLFMQRSHYTLGMIGISLTFGIPILLMIYGGVKLLFKIHYRNRWMNISAGIIWLVGLSIALFVGITTGKDFSEGGKVRQEVKLVQHDTLYLTLNKSKELMAQLNLNEDEYEERHRNKHGRNRMNVQTEHSDYIVANNGDKKFIVGHAYLNIVPSLTDNFELFIIKKARGEDKRTAVERAKVIEYKVAQSDSTITLDELFTVSGSEKFRVQEVTVLLKVPRGKVIHMDKSLLDFISDIENVTNTFDDDMVGRRWKMTKDGLECIDCDGLDLTNGNEDDHDFEIPVPPAPPTLPHDVNVSVKDADVKIDDDGIKVKANGARVEIGKNGIHVDSKDNKGEKGDKGEKGNKGEKGEK